MRNLFGTAAARGAGAALMVVGVMTPLVGTFTPAGGDVGDTAVVTLEDGTNGCNGVLPTPGSENTTKRLDPSFPSNFDPGGVVGFVIDYPVDGSDVAGRTTFVITDCVFVDDTAIARYSVSFVPNTAAFQLRFSVPIPAGTPLGARFCNYAKTTAAPSQSQASNRKAGPACFTVGGGLRIEKRSGSTTGPLLAGASFTVVCSPTVTQPPTIITGLSNQSRTNPNGTVSAGGTAATGAIAVDGPSGTPCTVSETAAPPGYQLDAAPRNLVIPIGTGQTVDVFVNLRLGDLVVSKATSGGSGTFTFDVDCDGTAFDQALTITDSGTRTITGIPVATSCRVTERADNRFTSVSVPADGEVTIATGTNTVAFTNTRDTGDLVVAKSTTGGTGDLTFTFHVDCDGTGWDRELTIPANGSATVGGIPTGTSCTVTEEPHALFTSTSVPTDGTLTIATGSNTVAFTNVRKTGDLVVSKETTGGSGTFTFDVDCDGTAFDREVTITDSGSRAVEGIPTGTSCTVTERDHDLFSGFSNPADGRVVIVEGTNTVAFTNARDTGNLVVTKTTVGATGTFTFDVDCGGNTHDQSFTIDTSGSKTVSGIPTGTSCTVTERSNASFTAASVPADGRVTIGAATATVAFTNTARPTAVTLDKKVNGADHATSGDALVVHAGDPLAYTVEVTNTGDVPVKVGALADSLEADFAAVCPVPVGAALAPGSSFTCSYQRTARGSTENTASVEVTDSLGRRSSASDNAFVAVITPRLAIVKIATPASVSPGHEVTFSYTVVNTGDTTLDDVAVTDDVLGDIAFIGTMAPNATVTVNRSQVIQADSPTRNVGTATGTDVLGKKVGASATADIAIVLGVTLERPPTLPRTGAPVGLVALTGVALVAAGAALVVTGRRRSRD